MPETTGASAPEESARADTGAADQPGGASAKDPLDKIREARRRWDALAEHGSRRRWRVGYVVAVLGPLAALVLATQVLMVGESSRWAVVLILAELLAVLAALAIGIFGLGHSAEWIRDRLRAEILRREEFLLRARLGPYFQADDRAKLQAAVDQRLAEIDNTASRPLDHLRPASRGQEWRDALEDAGAGNTASAEVDILATYVKERLTDQHDWYVEKAARWRGRHMAYSRLSTAALTAALVVAAMHLSFVLLSLPQDLGQEYWLLRRVIEVAAITLPSFGAAAVGLASLGQGKRLSASYQSVARELGRMRALFEDTGVDYRRGDLTDDEYELHLKRLVLSAEEVLSKELHDWWLVMHVEHVRGA